MMAILRGRHSCRYHMSQWCYSFGTFTYKTSVQLCTQIARWGSVRDHVPSPCWVTKLAPVQTIVWRHNGRDGVWNQQPHDCFLNRLFRRRSKKTSKLRVTGLCAGNSPITGEFPAQMASNAEYVSFWWRHHELLSSRITIRDYIDQVKHSIGPQQSQRKHWVLCCWFSIYCDPIKRDILYSTGTKTKDMNKTVNSQKASPLPALDKL